jgi:hypothetical protein
VEVLILDQAEIFLMQNWDHILSIFQAGYFVDILSPGQTETKQELSSIRLGCGSIFIESFRIQTQVFW